VVAATNKDLAEEVKAGRFREDLFYRLQVVPVELPPLRERGGDVKTLAQYFLTRQADELGRPELQLEENTLQALAAYQWPGNVRELENMIERIALLSEGDRIQVSDLPERLFEETPRVTEVFTLNEELPESGVDFNGLIDSYENKLITQALNQTQGNKKAAAKLLGLNRTTLVEKIKKKGLEGKIEMISSNDSDLEM
jgi:DNA-binding NtrC family response regulator